MEKYICPVCGCRTLDELGGFDICPVCYWEDDGFYEEDEPNSANECVTIRQARENFIKYGAFAERFAEKTRPPQDDEITVSYKNLINKNRR